MTATSTFTQLLSSGVLNATSSLLMAAKRWRESSKLPSERFRQRLPYGVKRVLEVPPIIRKSGRPLADRTEGAKESLKYDQ